MKIIKLLLIPFFALNCNAQTSLVSINEHNGLFYEPNTYFNDSDNEFNKFVGTWKWEQGLSSLTITFQKKLNVFFPEDNNYSDVLIAEYEYIDENGVSIVNTLPSLLNTTVLPYNRNIWGNNILPARPANPLSPNNSPTTIEYNRISLDIQDPERTYLRNSMKVRYIDDAVPKIEILIGGRGIQIIDPGQLPNMRVPYGFYKLTKQP